MMKQLRSALQYIENHAPAGDLTRTFVDLVSKELPSKFEVLSPSQSALLDPADKAAAVEDARSIQKSVKAALKAAIKSPSGYSPDGYASPGNSQNPLRSRSRSNRR